MGIVWILAQTSLVILAVWWLVEIVPRFPEDLHTLREGDASDRAAILLLWVATLVIGLLLFGFALRVVRRVWGGLEGWV